MPVSLATPIARTQSKVVLGAAVSVRGLKVAYGARTVITDMDLDIAAGEFISIVGRSGCGKSTLLRTLVGLLAPTAGSITLDRNAARVVFQEPRLLPWASVIENVLVGCASEITGTDRRRVAHETLASVGLSEKAGAWPADLSGGQRQRVALARALVSRPRFLILDEPLGALDALTTIEMQRLVANIHADLGCTVLLVTHDVSEAVLLSDRVVVMEEGLLTYNTTVDAPRPRRHGDAMLARIEREILTRLGV